MNERINVFVLAAGLGERLRPITNHIPKPLLPILGKTVIELILERIARLPVAKIGINLHYMKETIQTWITQSPYRQIVQSFPEEQILGTGGALKNAERFLMQGAFLVHNADIISDIDLMELLERHRASGHLVTLAVHDYSVFNNLSLDGKGFLKSVFKGAKGDKAFTGISVYAPEFLRFLPKGGSSVVDAWGRAVAEGYRIGTLDVTGCSWSDIGTPSAYGKAVFQRLRNEGENIFIHESSTGCGNIEMSGSVVIEKDAVITGTVSLKNCILLPAAAARTNERYENAIVGSDFIISLQDLETMESVGGYQGDLIGTGGSDRKYYRIARGEETSVLMQCQSGDPDYDRHMEYTRFFLRNNIPVPELLQTDSVNRRAVFEDLGDVSLYSWLKCRRPKEEREEIYRKVMDILVRLHSVATANVAECPLLEKRRFDYEHFRWETSYFLERYVHGLKSATIPHQEAILDEFHKLARKADSFPKTVVHRDFQSQNIMITRGQVPRIIDYQGARMGPPAYDIASILWDPYSRLEDGMRFRLLDHYMAGIKEREKDRFIEAEFWEELMVCRLQRHMQALGAYGFLSLVKGKKYFLKFIPEALRLLKEEIACVQKEYPALSSLILPL